MSEAKLRTVIQMWLSFQMTRHHCGRQVGFFCQHAPTGRWISRPWFCVSAACCWWRRLLLFVNMSQFIALRSEPAASMQQSIVGGAVLVNRTRVGVCLWVPVVPQRVSFFEPEDCQDRPTVFRSAPLRSPSRGAAPAGRTCLIGRCN